MNRDGIDACVEILCQQGCGEVLVTIERLRSGEEMAEVAGLTDLERKEVLRDLVQIMSAYGYQFDENI